MILLLAAGIGALLALGLGPTSLVPGEAGLRIAGRFFSAALQPAIDYEAEFVPPTAPPFLGRLAGSLFLTLAFAAAAMSVAIPIGGVLGVLASSAFWELGHAWGLRAVQPAVRVAIALMRSAGIPILGATVSGA